MVKSGGYSVWVEAGYDLFAHEGVDGIQVERIARILGLNKSGFYHYFGDRDSYFEGLMKHHLSLGQQFINEISVISTYDPEYLTVMIKYPLFVMANMQLVRNRHIPLLNKTYHDYCSKAEVFILPLWKNHLGLNEQPDLAKRYYELVRDMLYSRMSFENITYDFFHEVASEARVIIKELQHEHSEIQALTSPDSVLKQA
jgi:AcrR family transcriptional regulator